MILGFDALDTEGLAAERIPIGMRCRLVRDVEFIKFLAVLRKSSGGAIAARRLKQRIHCPIFTGLERLDLGFPVTDQAKRNRLNSTR